MGLFDKLTGKNNKVKVQFIDNTTGETIGITELTPEQLPQTFEINTTLNIREEQWVVEEAAPAQAADFIRSGSLVLKLRKIERIDPKDILYSLPTISSELPAVSISARFNSFEATLREDDWRQYEFLNHTSFPLVDIETAAIRKIWEDHSKETGEKFSAFDKIHVRETIGEPSLNIDFTALQQLLGVNDAGSLKLDGYTGFIQDAFALKTSATTYYGLLENNKVTLLGICQFSDNTIDEIRKLTTAFEILFISWYRGDIIVGDDYR
ncbi:MAG TPA: hypothetical protein VM802_04830 [Chitinophaga sp.]|uniref:hypothetical protein n=1 Tax=Chitinophaga sp. TaxID=1869181 RepID=UPI002D0CC983|nr:hypothetical protein [Chitinophaga sp.]HVI44165.1 hypothetical protein [Chitinophaga sp.]